LKLMKLRSLLGPQRPSGLNSQIKTGDEDAQRRPDLTPAV
jgi:hypothetical protein